MQTTNTVLLIRPKNFGYNCDTAVNNAFQNNISLSKKRIQEEVYKEFNNVVEALKSKGLQTIVIEDTIKPQKPDAIFPNNWFSTHSNGSIVLYPIFAPNRRLEKRKIIIRLLKEKYNFKTVIDLYKFEKKQQFLEGTGSVVFNHISKIAYACISERTDMFVLKKLCKLLNYSFIGFTATDATNKPIYHTNVMLCITNKVVIICLESIKNKKEQTSLLNSFTNANLEIFAISQQQVQQFAGNMLSLSNAKGNDYLVLSQSAYISLTKEQKITLKKHHKLIKVNIPTIQQIGGGGIRCMLAEIFIPA